MALECFEVRVEKLTKIGFFKVRCCRGFIRKGTKIRRSMAVPSAVVPLKGRLAMYSCACADVRAVPCADEKARRRDPRLFNYTGIACPDMKKVHFFVIALRVMASCAAFVCTLHCSPPVALHAMHEETLQITKRTLSAQDVFPRNVPIVSVSSDPGSPPLAGQHLRARRPVPVRAQRLRVLAAPHPVRPSTH